MSRHPPIPPNELAAIERRFELLISNLLRAGVWLSLTLTLTGLAVMFAHHPEFLTSPETLTPLMHPERGGGAMHSQGATLIMTGLILLIATPVLRVAVSIVAFARQRDRAYVLITSGVLTLLLLSFLMGKAG